MAHYNDRKIKGYNFFNNTQKKWKSIKDASLELDINHQKISSILCGKQNTGDGWIFWYAEDETPKDLIQEIRKNGFENYTQNSKKFIRTNRGGSNGNS